MFLAVAAPGFASLGNRLNVMRTGAPPLDVCFADPGPVGQAIRYGIGIHKGEHWGRAN